MKRKYASIGILLTLLAASTAGADELRIATGHTFINRVFDPVRRAFRDKTGIDIKVLFRDPIPALSDLEKGGVDAAGASLPLEEWLEQGRSAGVPVKELAAYISYVPVTEKLMIVVNEGNRIKVLSNEQLKAVFTGRVLNWREVGGDDAPILVVWPSINSGALIIFKQRILDNGPLTKVIYDVESIADTPDAIAATPEAIGIITGTAPGKGVKEIAPAIVRPLTLLYKGKAVPNLQKLLDFLKGEGQRYLQ
ncbi:MAG: substrate-binding domain-containing protein [Deltaproteobacteria bacterium]|nr:substrate-binding domain-containing protein [Deltaproteobacteria bacterium]